MIKSELVLKIAEQNPHLYQRDVENIVNAILDTIADALARGDRVEGFVVDGRAPMELRDLLELRVGRAGAARRGRAAERSSGASRPAACRTARSRPRRTRRSPLRSTGSAPLELRRGRRGPDGSAPSRQLADQAGRLGPLRRHARVRRVRRRAADQDRPGLEARRGRPAARPQGDGRDRAPAPHPAGRRADLAAARTTTSTRSRTSRS